MAPKHRMSTRACLDVFNPDLDLRAPHESIRKFELVPNMVEIAQEIHDMRQSIGVLMEAINS